MTADSEGGDGPENELTDGDDVSPSPQQGPQQSTTPTGASGAASQGGGQDQQQGLEDQESVADVRVTFSTVRAASTPAGVVDRISPGGAVTVTVAVAGWHPPMAPIRLSIDGVGGGNGEATIGGAATQEITTNGSVELRGTTQTDPGNTGHLRVVANIGTTTVGRSNPFTVCAIPQNFSIAFQSEITGPKRGIRVQNQHESDSGTVGDLNEVRISEAVQYGAGTGVFAGITSGANSGYRSGTAFPTDSHSTPVALLTGAGHIDAQQTFKFLDNRSGARDIPVKNSGYLISRDVTDDGSGNISITTSKTGNAGTARGNTSDAGSGSASRTQAK